MSVLHPDPPAFSSAGLVRKWSSRFAALAGLPMPMPSPAPLLFSAAEPGARAQATRSQSQPSPAQLQSASEQAPSESSVAELASQMGADAVAGPASSEQQNTCRKRVNIAVNESG